MQLKKSLTATFTATIVIQVVTMVGGIISARLLLPQGKGELTAVMLWPSMLASIGSLSIAEAVTYYVANESETDAKKVFASGMALALGLASGLLGIGYLILPMVLSGYGANVVSTGRIYLAYIPLNLIVLTLVAIILGKLHFTEYNALRAFVHMSFVAGMVVLYALNQVSVRTFALASLASVLITLFLTLWVVLRNGWLGWRIDVQTIKKLVGYGLKVHLGSVTSLFNLRLDQMLMSVFLMPSTLGLYVVAVTLSAGASLGASTIGLVAFPHVANLSPHQAKCQAYGRFIRLTVFLSLISAIGLFWLTPWVLLFFFGADYLPATWAARILILASIPLGCNMLFAAGFKAFNRPFVSSKAELIGLGVMGLSLWALLPRYEAIGAAWASLLAYSASCVFMVYSLQRELGLTPEDLFRPTTEDVEYVRLQLTHFHTQIIGCIHVVRSVLFRRSAEGKN